MKQSTAIKLAGAAGTVAGLRKVAIINMGISSAASEGSQQLVIDALEKVEGILDAAIAEHHAEQAAEVCEGNESYQGHAVAVQQEAAINDKANATGDVRNASRAASNG